VISGCIAIMMGRATTTTAAMATVSLLAKGRCSVVENSIKAHGCEPLFYSANHFGILNIMKYKIVHSRISNLFFFISNLAEWHFSCRTEYNKEWIKQTGVLTEKESEAINVFGDVMRKYGFEYKKNKLVYLGQYFFLNSEKEAWEEVEKNVMEGEYKKIRSVFRMFEPRFKKIWDEKGIKAWGRSLKKIAESENGIKLMAAMERAIKPDKKLEDFVVHIIPSPINNKSASGGANLGCGHITLEAAIEDNSDEYMETALGVMAHEMVHVLLDNNRKLSKIIGAAASRDGMDLLDLVQPKMSKKNILTEIVVGGIAPSGYIYQAHAKHFSPLLRNLGWIDVLLYDMEAIKEKKIISYDGLYYYVIWQMYPLSQYYFEKKRAIDKKFIDEMTRVISVIKKGAY